MHTILFTFLFSLQYIVNLAIAIPAVAPPSNSLSLELPPSNLTNSNATNATLSAIVLPWTLNVPNSDIKLRYGFEGTFPFRKSLDADYVLGLLRSAQEAAGTGIAKWGEDTRLDTDTTSNCKVTAYGLRLWIRRLPPPDNRAYTWGQVEAVIRGLGIIMHVGEKPYEIEFRFYGEDIFGSKQVLGQGNIQKWPPNPSA